MTRAGATVTRMVPGSPTNLTETRFLLRSRADALLAIGNEDSRDVGVLKRTALQRMALD